MSALFPAVGEPTRSRPWMPGYGISTDVDGLLDWSWARTRLESHRTYWVCTAGTGQAPHAAPVWGIWDEAVFVFSTGDSSRKHKNLVANPRCAVALDLGEESLVVNGSAAFLGRSGEPVLAPVSARYQAKYGTDLAAMNEPLFAVEAFTVIAQIDRDGQFTRTATRWTWHRNRQ